MKCPACQYVCSDLRDICPKCFLDLRAEKKLIGIPVINPDISYNELLSKSFKPSKVTVVKADKPKKTAPVPTPSDHLFARIKSFTKGLFQNKEKAKPPTTDDVIRPKQQPIRPAPPPKQEHVVMSKPIPPQVKEATDTPKEEALSQPSILVTEEVTKSLTDIDSSLTLFKEENPPEQPLSSISDSFEVVDDSPLPAIDDGAPLISAPVTEQIADTPVQQSESNSEWNLNLSQDTPVDNDSGELPTSELSLNLGASTTEPIMSVEVPQENVSEPLFQEASSEQVPALESTPNDLNLSLATEADIPTEITETVSLNDFAPVEIKDEAETVSTDIPVTEIVSETPQIIEATEVTSQEPIEKSSELLISDDLIQQALQGAEPPPVLYDGDVEVGGNSHEATNGFPTEVFEIDASPSELSMIAKELSDDESTTQDFDAAIPEIPIEAIPAPLEQVSMFSDSGDQQIISSSIDDQETFSAYSSEEVSEISDSNDTQFIETDEEIVQDTSAWDDSEEIFDAEEVQEEPGEELVEQSEYTASANQQFEYNETNSEEINAIFDQCLSAIPVNEDFEISIEQFYSSRDDSDIQILFGLTADSIENPAYVRALSNDVNMSENRHLDSEDLENLVHATEDSLSKPTVSMKAGHMSERDKIRKALGSKDSEDLYSANKKKFRSVGLGRRLSCWAIDLATSFVIGVSTSVLLSYLIFTELLESLNNIAHVDIFEVLPLAMLIVVSTVIAMLVYPVVSQAIIHNSLGTKITKVHILGRDFKKARTHNLIIRAAVFPMSVLTLSALAPLIRKRSLHDLVSRTDMYTN